MQRRHSWNDTDDQKAGDGQGRTGVYRLSDCRYHEGNECGFRVKVQELRVDGGASNNEYLMQFQSDIADTVVKIPDAKELSGIGRLTRRDWPRDGKGGL